MGVILNLKSANKVYSKHFDLPEGVLLSLTPSEVANPAV